MRQESKRRDSYTPEETERVRATCLFLATRLGDYREDVVLIGGLVPTLLVSSDEVDFEAGEELHVSTHDVDLGLALTLLEDQRYAVISERLRNAGFKPDVTESGERIRQRWQLDGHNVSVDFLIPPSSPDLEGGTLQNLESDFAAIY
ncbi:MAG: hypothetical protein BMS9Abin05_0999 [Rhodothermia bacterium]|nr:MAG: hypothetical protein BMS9Abin05_0999 [Rhodothermia bacterium]